MLGFSEAGDCVVRTILRVVVLYNPEELERIEVIVFGTKTDDVYTPDILRSVTVTTLRFSVCTSAVSQRCI